MNAFMRLGCIRSRAGHLLFPRMRNSSSLLNAAPPGMTVPVSRPLKDIVKVPLLEREPTVTVSEIWQAHHNEAHTAAGISISREEYYELKPKSRECPMFVVPVRREGGFFTLISQFQDHRCLLTFLEDYKKNPWTADPYMTITFYEDMLQTKGLVLVRGDFVAGRLTKEEANRILDIIRRYYTRPEEYRTVHAFNKAPKEFDFTRYLSRV